MKDELNARRIDEKRLLEIQLIGEDGQPESFEHVLTFMYEDERYMALIPADKADEDEALLVFMRIEPRKIDGEDAYSVVDNEVMQNELYEVFCELLGEEYVDEEDEEYDTDEE